MPPKTNQSSTLPEGKVKKHVKLTEINYRRNTDSDYTEKIEELEKNFNYSSNSNYYWGPPELSILYGTPLYEEASPSQKRALNHFYWTKQYNQTAATEANAVLYNQVTAGVFANLGGHETLCQELELETKQERYHIHAFHAMGYKTQVALIGKKGFNANVRGKLSKSKNNSAKGLASLLLPQLLSFNLPKFQDDSFRFITNQVVLKSKANCYSQYLKELERKGEPIPAQTTGLLGQIGSRPFLQFFTLNCGTSPFLACVFYVPRFMANMLLKNYEYRYSQYYRELEKKGKFIPAPTAVSYYHLLDESFHTTTSQLIAQDLYKEFSKPTAYEKFLANLVIYRTQKLVLSGLSGGLPGVFRNDASFMLSFYNLLQTSIFNMSFHEALHWTKKCFCEEHEGFHVNLKFHKHLLSDLRRSFEKIDYLWPVNREMRLMASGGSIAKAIQKNIKVFERFSKSVAN